MGRHHDGRNDVILLVMKIVGNVCFGCGDDIDNHAVVDGGDVDLGMTKMKRATSSMMVVLTDLVTNGPIAGVPVM